VPRVSGYLRRLLTTTAAYQLGDIVSKFIAVGLLPVYTRQLTEADYGVAELLLTLVIFTSILARLGIGEAFVRYYYGDEDPARRDALVRRTVAVVLATTTLLACVAAALSGPLSQLVLSHRDTTTFLVAVLGLWSFTNLEIAYAILRVDERARAYATASVSNVLLTIAATLVLVVALHDGARGLLLGNFGASTVVLLALWIALRERLRPARATVAPERLGLLLRFGLPTVPADASVYALNLVDRYYLYHARSAALAGVYSVAVRLAGVVVFTVRAFQYAWPPLAYSVADDAEAARLYALVTTYYLLLTGWVVAGVALLGRWLVRLLAAPAFFGAHRALTWVALGWALYGLYVIFIVIAGRAKVTTRNFPAAVAGLIANVVLLVVLVPSLGITGAGLSLTGAYLVMLTFMYFATRRLFAVGFEWGRLAHLALVLGGAAAAGELLLPAHGAGGLVSRAAVVLAIPPLLLATGFLRPAERSALRGLPQRLRAATARA
jgi:O-antigen/teichoic acid export membrane protein